jgi:hypothetical protein
MSESLPRTLLEAVDKALAGDWQAAHRIVQEHEEDATANWIQAELLEIKAALSG